MRSILVIFCFVSLLHACAKKTVYRTPPSDGLAVRIELSGVPDKTPLFFTFNADGQGINFFLFKSGGKVESYFDACGKCYPRKLGFRAEDKGIVCRTCNVRYSLEDLKDGIGSCYPIRLAGRVEGQVYVVDLAEIRKGLKYF